MDEAEYRAHGCPNCVCEITEFQESPTSWEINMSRETGPGHIVLGEKDWDNLMEVLANPPPPTEALIRARQRYVEMKQQQIRDEMDEHMVKTSSAKKL